MVIYGRPTVQFGTVVGRIAEKVDVVSPQDTVLICRDRVPNVDLSSFAALLATAAVAVPVRNARMVVCESIAHLVPDDLVSVNGKSGHIRTLFRSRSSHNALFVTESCNNNCVMCSQPPKNESDEGSLLSICLRILELLKTTPPPHIGITGGEPTLLGDGLLNLLNNLKVKLPSTSITVLTNARRFSDPKLCAAIAQVGHPSLRFSVPLHADVPDIHDYVAQCRDAFYETVNGIYNMASSGMNVEIRIVLHAFSVPRLVSLAEWIWRKIPFVHQVVFVGLENMGYVKKNFAALSIDPVNYAGSLTAAAMHLYRRGFNVSIYNLPLCVLPPELWGFARQSISDHKQILLEACGECEVAEHCPGFFLSAENRHSSGIAPIRLAAMAACRLTGGMSSHA